MCRGSSFTAKIFRPSDDRIVLQSFPDGFTIRQYTTVVPIDTAKRVSNVVLYYFPRKRRSFHRRLDGSPVVRVRFVINVCGFLWQFLRQTLDLTSLIKLHKTLIRRYPHRFLILLNTPSRVNTYYFRVHRIYLSHKRVENLVV